jgi:predicted SnoaL-like aldol condensation-catalyzing enzyme
MKQVLFVAATVCSCFLLSCNNAGSNASANSQGEKNIMVVHDIYKGIETGDTSKLDGIADDGIDHMGPKGTEIKGGDNIKKMLADMHNHMKDLKMEVVAEAANGDYVFVWCHMTGTCTDSSMGMKAGMAMDSKSVDVIKFKDGKATDHWGYLDPADMMKMMPSPPMGGTMKMDSTHKM